MTLIKLLLFNFIIYIFSKEIIEHELLDINKFSTKKLDISDHFLQKNLIFQSPLNENNQFIFKSEEKNSGIYQHVQNIDLKIFSPLIFTFQFKTNSKNLSPFMYIMIKYKDGTFLNSWLSKNTIQPNEINTECTILPYKKQIESIFVSFTVDFHEKEQNLSLLSISVKTFSKKTQNTSVNLNELTTNCPNIIKTKPVTFHTLRNSFQSFYISVNFLIKKKDINEVTLCMNLNKKTIPKLLHFVKRYKGPISVSYFLEEKKDYEIITNLWVENFLVRKYVNIHLISKINNKYDYLNNVIPINKLKNVAIENSKTNFVLLIDSNVILPKDFKNMIKKEYLE